MFVDDGIEGHPVPPAGGEVVDVHVWISATTQHTTFHLQLSFGLSPSSEVNGVTEQRLSDPTSGLFFCFFFCISGVGGDVWRVFGLTLVSLVSHLSYGAGTHPAVFI